jgi:hypothetical protein
MNRIELTIIVALVILHIFATVYATSADAKQVRVLPKTLWVVLCLFLPLAGPLLYITIGRPVDGESGQGAKSWGPRAPDDDPAFLKDLDDRLRRDKDNKDG